MKSNNCYSRGGILLSLSHLRETPLLRCTLHARSLRRARGRFFRRVFLSPAEVSTVIKSLWRTHSPEKKPPPSLSHRRSYAFLCTLEKRAEVHPRQVCKYSFFPCNFSTEKKTSSEAERERTIDRSVGRSRYSRPSPTTEVLLI